MASWHITGERGSGKTLWLILCAEDAQLSGREVQSNFDMKIPHKIYTLEQLIRQELSNCLILFDEAHLFADSHQSGSNINRLLRYFVYQSRKTSVDVMSVSQFSTGLDLSLRSTADFHIICEKLPDESGFIYNICKRPDLAITPLDNFYHGLIRINQFVVFKKQLKKIFESYDTYKLFDIMEVEQQKENVKDTIKQMKSIGHLSDKEKEIFKVLKGK